MKTFEQKINYVINRDRKRKTIRALMFVLLGFLVARVIIYLT